MKEILSGLLHVPVVEEEFKDKDRLPLYLAVGYEIRMFSVLDMDILFVTPRQQLTFAALKKQWEKFVSVTGLQCVICGNEYTRYGRERMVELGIPFFFGKDNMYLPFLGIAFGKKKLIHLPEAEVFSPLTQKMILLAIYEKWNKFSTKEISQKMEISRITAARILTQLQALELPLVVLEGKTKYFRHSGSRKELYQMCRGYFINPVVKKLPLAERPMDICRTSGYSAIAECSMLADNAYPTYGVTRLEFQKLRIEEYPIQPPTDVPVCEVQVLNYVIEHDGHVDQISAYLSLSENEKKEPRVESALDEMLEEVLHD